MCPLYGRTWSLIYSLDKHQSSPNKVPHQLTNCTQQSPSGKADVSDSSQEIPCTLWNPKVPYHIHNSLPLVPVQSQINLVNTVSPNSLQVHFNIIIPSILPSSKWSLSHIFPPQPYMHLSSPLYVSHAPPISILSPNVHQSSNSFKDLNIHAA